MNKPLTIIDGFLQIVASGKSIVLCHNPAQFQQIEPTSVPTKDMTLVS